MTVTSAVALYMGSVLGGGILALPGLTAQVAGPGAVVAWIAVSLFSLPLAFMFARLSSVLPDGGGVSIFARRAFGDIWGDVTGWLYFWIIPVGQPAVMLSGMYYLAFALKLDRKTVFFLAFLMLLAAGMLNLVGRRLSARTQLGLAATIVALLVGTFIGSLPHIDWSRFARIAFLDPGSLGSAAALILWAYIGWENVSCIAEDFRNPRRDFPLSVTMAVLIVGLLYTSASISVIGVIPASDIPRYQAPLAEVIHRVIGFDAAWVTSLIGSLIVGASAMAFVWGGSNLAVSLARHHCLPQILLRSDSRLGTPVVAIIFLELLYLVSLTIIYISNVSLDFLARVVGASVVLTYIISAAAYLKLTPCPRTLDLLPPVASVLFAAILIPFFGFSFVYPVLTVLIYFIYRAWQNM